MADETKADEVGGPAPAGDTGKNVSSGGKKHYDRPAPEDLFDLTKPIPSVEKPDKEEHDSTLAVLDAEIDKLRKEKEKVQDKLDNFMKSLKSAESNKDKTALQELKQQKKELIKEKKNIRDRLDAVKKESDKMFRDQKQVKSSVKYSSAQEIDEEIWRLQRRQETVSMSLSEEKKLIKEITQLQSMKSTVAQLKSKEINLNDVKEQKRILNGQLKAKDDEIDAVQAEIEKKNDVLKTMNEKEDDIKVQKEAFFSEKNILKEKIDKKYQEKDEVREKFREANNAWYNYKRAKAAQKKLQYEEEKRKREEERLEWEKKKEEEEMQKVPYEEEMALCEYLADYLTKTYLEEKKKKVEEKKVDVFQNADNPFAGVKPMKKNEDEVYLKMGKGKKPRVKAAKKEKKGNKSAAFTLNVDSFEQFGLLSLIPPTSLEMVEQSVKDLRAKKEWYSQQPRGSVPTAKEIRKMNEKVSLSKENKNTKSGNEAVSSSQGRSKGGFSLTDDDFVPLGSSSSRVALNSTWGMKVAGEQPIEVNGNDLKPNDVVEVGANGP